MRASKDGSVWAIFLGGTSRGSVAFGNPCFPGGKEKREEATKFEKFKRRKPREKPRKEKRNFQ